MKKGSPRDYDAEAGCFEQPAQKSQTGEPHECYPLYRIGRTQENHQLLHKDCRRPNGAGRQAGRHAGSFAQMKESVRKAWTDGKFTTPRATTLVKQRRILRLRPVCPRLLCPDLF